MLPASARLWFSDIRDRGRANAVEAYTAKYESPALLAAEFAALRAGGAGKPWLVLGFPRSRHRLVCWGCGHTSCASGDADITNNALQHTYSRRLQYPVVDLTDGSGVAVGLAVAVGAVWLQTWW